MFDIHVTLDDRPGSLAAFGEALAGAGVSVEGGGVAVVGDVGVAHFLVADGIGAAAALDAAGFALEAVTPVLLTRLDQARAGQLGSLTRALADSGVNIEVQYSDHDGQLVLVVDNPEQGLQAIADWEAAG